MLFVIIKDVYNVSSNVLSLKIPDSIRTISFVNHQQVLIFVFKQIYNLFICLLITGNNIIKIRF